MAAPSPTPTDGATAMATASLQARREPGESWRDTEVQHLPDNNLKLIIPALMLTMFLAAIDQTIITTSLPTIIEDIGGEKGYSWIGAAFLLMSAFFMPLYGRLSDIMGRRGVLYFCIALFLLGSALCGAAKSFIWLAVCRGVQGAGAGGLQQMVLIILADIVSLADRGKYGGLMSATWGVASVVGPVIGGVFADYASWRWSFYINLPGGAIAAVMLFFLKLNPRPSKSLRTHIAEFDFLGLFLLMSGVAMLLVGFTFGETSWSQTRTIVLLVLGIVFILAAAIWEPFTKRTPILPPRLFKTRTTAALMIGAFLHAFVFFAQGYWIPVYFQTMGASATMSGVRLVPYCVAASGTATVAGLTLTRTGRYRPIIWYGWAVSIIGMGLMIMMDDKTSTAKQEIWVVVFGLGIGNLFQPPIVALQASMPLDMMAAATSTFTLVRMLGGTMGISVGGSVFSTQVQHRIKNYVEQGLLSPTINLAAIERDVRNIKKIPDLAERHLIQHAFTKSISVIWIVCTPILFVGLLISLLLRHYSLARKTKRAGEDPLPEDTSTGRDPDIETAVVTPSNELEELKRISDGEPSTNGTEKVSGELASHK